MFNVWIASDLLSYKVRVAPVKLASFCHPLPPIASSIDPMLPWSLKVEWPESIRDAFSAKRRVQVHQLKVQMRRIWIAGITDKAQQRAFFYSLANLNLNACRLKVSVKNVSPTLKPQRDIVSANCVQCNGDCTFLAQGNSRFTSPKFVRCISYNKCALSWARIGDGLWGTSILTGTDDELSLNTGMFVTGSVGAIFDASTLPSIGKSTGEACWYCQGPWCTRINGHGTFHRQMVLQSIDSFLEANWYSHHFVFHW